MKSCLLVLCSLLASSASAQSTDRQILDHIRAELDSYYGSGAVPQTYRPTTSFELQQGIAFAKGGDTIVLSGTYEGNFTLPVHAGDAWVTIRGAADLPLQRVTDAPTLPTLRSIAIGVAPVQVANGAHHWRLLGVRVEATSNTYGRIRCGSADGYTDRAQVPHHIDFDRIVVTVPDTIEERRGVMLHCDDAIVQRSIVTGMHEEGADSQAVGGWEGTSRIQILDSDLSAASEPVLFGGGASSKVTPVPEDIEIRGNHIWKPLTWQGQPWNLKTLLELKNARRVVITDNLIENNWPAAQTGWAVLFTARGTATAPWMILEDVTFERNVVKNVSAGINILGLDDGVKTVNIIGRRMTIRNNLIITNRKDLDGDGRCYMLLGGANDIVIDHNTCINDGSSVLNVDRGNPTITGFRYTNNIALNGSYGIIGTAQAPGTPTIQDFFEKPVVQRNVFGGCSGTPYPATNLCPTLPMFWSQFTNAATGDYSLKPTSAWKASGTDGKDLGAALP